MADINLESWIKTTRSRIEKILTKNIMPFWYPATLDMKNGGYNLNHDVYGKPLGDGPKMVVSQARMVWYFSRLYETGWGGKDSLKAAEHGYKFLRDKMWDEKHLGFFWEIDQHDKVQRPYKHLYGQSYGLYALSEYAIASKDAEVLDYAWKLFNIMEKHAHDELYGGYRELFDQDWAEPKIDMPTSLAPSKSFKTMNTHLHLLEAFTVFYNITRDPLVKKRLTELIFILTNTVVRMRVGACTDLHNRDWTPVHGPRQDRISYGHNIEAIWLIVEACKAAEIPVGIFMNFFRDVYDYCMKFGLDEKNGGLYNSGPFNKPADQMGKIWWVQAEALVATAYMYTLLKNPVFIKHFDNILDWTEKYQVDWENGEWFDTILPDGKPTGGKAYIWKAAYHTGRAMIEVIRLLDQL
ncbi:MAG: AGE family epimerase/isomerase [Candidatus Bathyarchaeia archaeon]